MKRVAIALSVFIACGHLPVAAKQQSDRFYMPWMVEAGEVYVGEKTFHPKSDLTSARLLPLRLFILKNDAVDGSGKTVAPSGTELGIVTSRTFTACTLKAPKTTGLDAFKFMGADRYLCFVDTDRDSLFDYYFGMQTPLTGVLAGRGKVRLEKAANQLQQTPYTEARPELSKQAPRVVVRYARNEHFYSCVQGDTKTVSNCFGDRAVTHGKIFPLKISLLGAEFEILAKNGKQLTVTMTKPILQQPLTLYY
jgi:hypothetical protein